MFNNDYPLEKYILSQLTKHKHNVDLAVKAVHNKYPFIKRVDLKSIVSSIILKKVNNEKIGGFWQKIESKWIQSDQYDGGAGFEWSGKELPASSDESSIGNGKNVWNTPGDRPDGKAPRQHKDKDNNEIKDIMEVDTTDDGVSLEEVQKIYDKMMLDYTDYVQPVKERSEIVIEELREKGFGDIVNKIKVKV